MQIYIDCADCGERIGGWQVQGRQQTIFVNACFHSRKNLERTIKSLEWLISDAKQRFDDCRGNLEEGSQGGYSEELNEAIYLLGCLKELVGYGN